MSTATASPAAPPARPLLAVTAMQGCDVYKIGREAIITLQPSTGFVSVACPWHNELNGCHWWAHRGPQSLVDFLLDLDRSYAMGKLFDRSNLEEFDREETQRELKRAVIEMRREARAGWCELSAEDARDLWVAIECVDTADDAGRIEGISEPWYHIRMRDKSCVAWFWDVVWASFCGHLRAQKAQGAA